MKVVEPDVELAYELASKRYAHIEVDTAAALEQLDQIPISIHCWQGDDVRGFENPDGLLTGGIQTSGNYPGRARTAEELRADLDVALAQIPGKKRVNLHAIYLESESPVERDALEPKHFQRWVQWARANALGLDFNPTCFSHPLSEQATLSHPDAAVRRFWVDHCVASRRISDYFGRELGTPAIMNVWIPDGDKDLPADRLSPRRRLMGSLDEILAAPVGKDHKVAVEGKLFGIGAESYSASSNDFYLAYAATRKILLCLDAGHFHPDGKRRRQDIDGALLPGRNPVARFAAGALGLRSRCAARRSDSCDSAGDTFAVARRCACISGWTISMPALTAWRHGYRLRNMRKALLLALLEPAARQLDAERRFDGTARMALFEEQKSMPWSAIWDYYCASRGFPVGIEWLDTVRKYEATTLSSR